jgi:hypothetical protein
MRREPALEAGKTWRLPHDFEMRGGMQFMDQRSVGEELLGSFTTQLYGTSLTASYGSAVLTLAFTSTTTDGLKILRQFGGVPAFNSVIVSDFARRDENSWRVGLSYDFARIGLAGLKGFANYVHGELLANQHEDEIDTTADYCIDRGPLKNFWLRVRYAHNSLSNQPTTEDYRVILNYTFAFWRSPRNIAFSLFLKTLRYVSAAQIGGMAGLTVSRAWPMQLTIWF